MPGRENRKIEPAAQAGLVSIADPLPTRAPLNSLENGLYLEDRRILLPWGARRYHLVGLCHPDRMLINPGWEELFWQPTILFNGLVALQVQVVLYPYGYLDEAWIWLERGENLTANTFTYQKALLHLNRQFGRPVEEGAHPRCGDFLELHAWDWPRMRLGLFLRKGEMGDDFAYSVVAHIARRPDGCIPAPP